jgi:hypothetical protein
MLRALLLAFPVLVMPTSFAGAAVAAALIVRRAGVASRIGDVASQKALPA